MTDWSRAERVIRMVEYTVPCGGEGACWNQVQQALSAAVSEYRDNYGRTPPDNVMRVKERDGEIVISFQVKAGE